MIVVAWLSAVALLALLSRWHGTPMVPCHFRSITGVPCATCGSTRAGLAAMDGRFMDALLINPLVFTAIATVIAILGVRFVSGKQVVVSMSRTERAAAWGVAGAAFVGNWAYVIARHAAEAVGP